MASRRRAALGISLIEALVALAVMAFGMLGVVGMQSTLRFNADVSRQRGEAVRLAQEEVERWRNYSVLFAAEAASGQLAFEQIVDTGPDELTVPEVNTAFVRTTTVLPEAASGPRVRQVVVRVRWRDRRDDEQEVLLSTQVGYLPPEIGALVAQRGDRGPLARPGGRDPRLPPGTVPYDAGRSRFDPPGGGGVGWIFSNDTGLIVAICPPLPSSGPCTPTSRQLVAGFVAFALPAASDPEPAAPVASDAELPLSVLPADVRIGMRVLRQFPVAAGSDTGIESCFTSLSTDRRRLAYYCAVLADSTSLAWRGLVDPVISVGDSNRRATDTYPSRSTPDDTTAPTDSNPLNYRVCRYSPESINRYGFATPPTPAVALAHNTSHPYRYFNADKPYIDRNFLLIQAGHGGEVFNCPADDVNTPIQSSTFHHPNMPPPS
jgi:hypothetical protein